MANYVPFSSAEEAWHWHVRCSEFAGKPRTMWPDDLVGTPRPCEPHEVFAEICKAFRRHVLTKRHLEVLNRSTMIGSHSLTRKDVEWFEGAMNVLAVALKAKGVIAEGT